jgi:Dyp-type peroxidase family
MDDVARSETCRRCPSYWECVRPHGDDKGGLVVNLLNTTPIDEASPVARQWLTLLQGNILKFHGRQHATHLFFNARTSSTGRARRGVLRRLNASYVTSALQQLDEAERFRSTRVPAGLFGHLALSATGYDNIGRPAAQLFTEITEPQVRSNFVQGMATHAAADFGDVTAAWEPAYQRRIDGMLLLAHSDAGTLARAVRDARAVLAPAYDIAVEEKGHVVKQDDKGIEPFGFVDGRSQPLFLEGDFTNADGTPKESRQTWDPFAPLGLALVRDPGVADPLCHGSFLVYRKLEQNVRRFHEELATLAGSLPLTGNDVDRMGAMVVGRFPDGTPLELSRKALGKDRPDNDFDYDGDIPGKRCPHQAHIRKSNPRGSGPDNDMTKDRSRRIVRRGVVYGMEAPLTGPIAARPQAGVGLLFMCYQASVAFQFGFMQKGWCNAPDFPRSQVGVDPLIGDGDRSTHKWRPVHGGPQISAPLPFEPSITVKGGEFFFSPSKKFFADLPTT